jgi:4'-phosphopantetheinyl transferase
MAEPGMREHVAVRVYVVALDVAPAERRRCSALLSAPERARAAAFRFAADRDRYVVGRGTLRRILSRHGAGAPERIVIVDGTWGKPALRPPSELRFNVANSGDRALVAVAHRLEIGVDLERVRQLADVMSVARRSCTTVELEQLAAVPRHHRSRAFLRCWARKEACVKAIGVGLREPFDAFEVGVDLRAGVRTIGVPTDIGSTAVAVTDVELGPTWLAAVAACHALSPWD